MLENTLFFENSTGAGTNQPKSLYRNEPITVQLNPVVILAGVFIMLLILGIGIGCNESYNFLISGV